MAGPTTDYRAEVWTYTIQGDGAEGVLVAEGDGFRYTLPAALPGGATGTYAFALEGRIQPVVDGPTFSAENPVFYAPVTDGRGGAPTHGRGPRALQWLSLRLG